MAVLLGWMKRRDVRVKLSHDMVQDPFEPSSSKGPRDTSFGGLNIDNANSQSRTSQRRCGISTDCARNISTDRATHDTRQSCSHLI
jgi:hypothetical protein